VNALQVLERFVRAPGTVPDGARCQLCAAGIDDERHPHLVDLEEQALLCACSICARMFAQPASATPRFKTVPTRVLVDPSFALDAAAWAALGIPVGLAFMFESSRLRRWVALYPSPAGATESDLDAERVAAVVRDAPLLAGMEPDTEALLVYRRLERDAESFRAPIDVCYRLVGEVRRTWQGFTGGDVARARIDALFAELRARAEAIG
jgi:hypothetical protein